MSNDAQILKDTKIWDVHKMESLGHEILHILWTATVEFFIWYKNVSKPNTISQNIHSWQLLSEIDSYKVTFSLTAVSLTLYNYQQTTGVSVETQLLTPVSENISIPAIVIRIHWFCTVLYGPYRFILFFIISMNVLQAQI